MLSPGGFCAVKAGGLALLRRCPTTRWTRVRTGRESDWLKAKEKGKRKKISRRAVNSDVIRLMIGFEIELNGKSLGTAGADDLSVLTAIVSAVGKLGPDSTGAHQREHHYDIELTVGGLTSRAEGSPNEHLDWIRRALKTGDVVTVRLVEPNVADAPIASMRKPADGDYQKLYEELSSANREDTDDG